METQLELVEKKRESGDRNLGKKRFHSGKRSSAGAVHLPDWWITNGQSRTTQLVVSYKEGKKISKLREPRNLYALNNQHHYSNINIPRWPVEMKVLSEYPHHLEYLPPDPEAFHNSELITDDSDNFPNLTKVEGGKLVYENSSGQTKYFDRSQIGGNVIKAVSCHKLTDTLHFESRFESGNLYKAVKVGPCDYQLWLRTDLYTNKYTQWYYFRVENTQAEKVYRFTIMNLMKSSSLYSSGMKPLMYSEQEAKKNGIGWKRVGTNVNYYKNELKREDVKGEKYLYSLSWSVVFPHAGDRCYFAHCYPYTYTDLQEYLRKMSKDPARSHYCKQKLLTRTLAGNFVYIITITSPSKCPADAKNKRAVVVSARVHPGETNSSWMMKGLLDYLTSDKPDAKLLRDTFVFKIIPMLNPDGVIVGNYRCSLSGRDLNRNYKTALKDSFPSVWHTREMIRRLSEEREITLYCDLHGHSRQQNVFIYGCEDRRNLTNGFKERVFPMMMSKNCEDKFCFNRCKFKVQKNKSGTGRVVMWNLGIKNSYTLEATFCGSTLGAKSGHHFTTADFESMGYHLCDTLLDYCDPDIAKYLSVLNQLEFYVKSLVLERMKEKGVAQPDINLSDIDLDRDYTSESSTSGSDSSVSDGLPMHILYLQPENATKKKHLKTRKERNRRRARTLVKQVKEKQKEDKRQDRPPSTDNDLSSERKKKNYVAVSRPKRPKTPQRGPLQVAKPPSRHISDVKIRHDLDSMPNSYGQNRMPVSSDGLTIPRLQYTALRTCFGLAPATPGRSLRRWSARRYNASDGVTDEEESSNFIGRYMARQIRISSPARGNGSKNDKSDLQRKLEVYNESYNMLATAQSYNCDKHDRDGKKRNDNKGSMEKYCPHHAAMVLRKANEKKKEDGDEATFQYLSFSPSPSRSSSQEKVSCRNVRQLPMSSKALVSGVKVAEGNGGDERGLSCAPGRRKSESNFPPLQSAARTSFNNERKTFNFRGVTQHPKSSTGHHSLASENNLGYNDQLSFLVNGENTDDVKKAEVPNPLRTASSSPSADFTTQLRDETHNLEKRPSECYSPDIKTGDHSPVFVLDVSSTEEGVAKTEEERNPNTKEEPSLKTVERLRQKLQNLNAAGRMVTFALNNQLDDVEESIHKSLLNEYINYQQERNVRCSRTFSKIKRPLQKPSAKTTNGEEQRPKKCGEVTKKQETKIAKESGTAFE